MRNRRKGRIACFTRSNRTIYSRGSNVASAESTCLLSGCLARNLKKEMKNKKTRRSTDPSRKSLIEISFDYIYTIRFNFHKLRLEISLDREIEEKKELLKALSSRYLEENLHGGEQECCSPRGKEIVGWQYALTPFHRVRRKKVNSPCIHFLTRSKRTNSFHPRFSSFEERLFSSFLFFLPLSFFPSPVFAISRLRNGSMLEGPVRSRTRCSFYKRDYLVSQEGLVLHSGPVSIE